MFTVGVCIYTMYTILYLHSTKCVSEVLTQHYNLEKPI